MRSRHKIAFQYCRIHLIGMSEVHRRRGRRSRRIFLFAWKIILFATIAIVRLERRLCSRPAEQRRHDDMVVLLFIGGRPNNTSIV